MNQPSFLIQQQQQQTPLSYQSRLPPTLYSTCLTYICSSLDAICEHHLKPTSSKHHHHHHHHHSQLGGFRQPTIALNHVVSEDLLERLVQLNKLNDSTLSLFISSSSSLKKLHLRNCVLNKDLLRHVLKQHNLDELVLNNLQVHSSSSLNSHYHYHTSDVDELIFMSAGGGAGQQSSSTMSATININELIESLNDWSQSNLKSLNVARNQSLFSSILIKNMGLLGSSLTRLNVSFTSFNNHSLDIICHDLPLIEFLDISGTKVNDIGPLTRLKSTLRALYMYHMRASLNDDIVPIVASLPKLTHLDLSCDISTKIFADTSLSLFDVNHLFEEFTRARLAEFRFLDISGKTGIKQEILCEFLKSYPKLKFLGLALTNANSFDIFNQTTIDNSALKPFSSALHLSVSSPALSQINAEKMKNDDMNRLANVLSSKTSLTSSSSEQDLLSLSFARNLVVTGESNEAQVIAALKTYKHRLIYIQKALYHLYLLSRGFQETRLDLLELIMELMQIHSKSQSVQLVATTCIFNLTKANMYTSVPAHMLTQVINLVLNTMINYPNCATLQKNCLYILLNEEMLNSCSFNKYICVKATLECLSSFNDTNVINSSIAICSQVALNAEYKYRAQFIKLSEPKYVQKLILIINNCLQNFTNDSILHSVLDILWSLSEMNTDWCCNFITQNGLNIYLNLIDLFENDLDISKKCLYLIYNLSEIPQIRPILFCHPIANLVKRMLYHEDQKVSFLSVGFFVNLLAYMPDSDWDWHASLINPSKISDFKQELENIIDSWSSFDSSGSLFCHHSQNSLVKLLELSDEAQMWAIWAIYYSFRFIPSIESANLVKCALKSLLANEKTAKNVYDLCSHILNIIETTSVIFKI